MTAAPIRAGQLRDSISFQIATDTPDGVGGTTRTWDDVATCSALVEPINGGEAFKAGVIRSTQFYRITVRHRAGITPRHRIMWNGTLLNIHTCADPDGRRRALLITAESGVGDP